ncbi:MAG: T9SS type A sorting domain-containing protein [Fidelibacterota bacterium]|nr:MAG: T9SS type A sorting domain-containing protein [Candidatus Neomarinimicrobiota bacterium]
MATYKTHGTTAWTDQNWEVTNGYTHELLNYDVRAHYTTENTEATPNFGSVAKFARLVFKRIQQAFTETPDQFNLSPAHPNPFNPVATICYDLPEASEVRLVIYDLKGRKVMWWTCFEEAGSQEVIWDSRDMNGVLVPTGVYIYRFVAVGHETNERFEASKKMVLMK